MASTSKCSIGVYLNEECHKTTYNSQIGSRHIDMFAEEDQLLIKLRSGIDQPLADICVIIMRNISLSDIFHSNTSAATHFWRIKNHAEVRR